MDIIHPASQSATASALSSVSALADAIAPLRPASDPKFEQFHLQSGSLAAQVEMLIKHYDNRKILFLGDDDHVSVIAARFSQIQPVVYEIDERVVASLQEWGSRLQLLGSSVHHADLRSLESGAVTCDAFYLNPPFSSKNQGHGLRFWLSKALDLCHPICEGVVVMPANIDLTWVNQNWLSMQEFASQNGFRVISVEDSQLQAYNMTNDVGLRSQNLRLRRIDVTRRRSEPVRWGDAIYR